MIRFDNVCKTFRFKGQRKVVADHIDCVFPTGTSTGILGRNGAGKSTLLRMIAGTIEPDRGLISYDGTMSYPVGFAGSFHPELTGAQNVRFVARIYGIDSDDLVAFVRDFAGIGRHFDLPMRTYSSGMRSRLAFGCSMGVPFDTYLVDEVTAVGDAEFRKGASQLFRERMATASAVVVSHGLGEIRQICDRVCVLDQGKLQYFEDVEEGIALHQRNMGITPTRKIVRPVS
jgi:capsular polysaccharide transport system ATP-binding protein